ncbi:MAG: hypothetical protein WC285_02995 [Candidatus Gracilibacteria bacterium]|jgi:hypothetical protein
MDDLIAELYQSPKMIITTDDLALIWQKNNRNNLKADAGFMLKNYISVMN